MLKKIILGVVIFLIFTLLAENTASYVAEAQVIPEKTIWREEELLALAEQYALAHSTSVSKVKSIVVCEAPWKRDEQGRYYDESDAQSRIRYNVGQIARNPSWGEVGDRERSFGPVQIHEPAHPNTTREQAVDPDFALDFLAENVANGRSSMWTCSRGS